MQTVLPTLSATGWIRNIGEKADMLFSQYLAADFSQTYLYPGEVSSLSKHIQDNNNDPQKTRSAIEDGLYTYFNRYFESAEVKVRTDLPNPDDPDKINISVDVNVVENGYRYNLGKELHTVKGKLIQVFDIVNG